MTGVDRVASELVLRLSEEYVLTVGKWLLMVLTCLVGVVAEDRLGDDVFAVVDLVFWLVVVALTCGREGSITTSSSLPAA